jgi:SPP1 family predicted phage head-tail adaptor
VKPLPHRLEFQSKVIPEDRDTYGAPQEMWAVAFTSWCDFEPVGGREFPITAKVAAEATARFRVRFRQVLLDPLAVDKYRIRFQNRIWNIHRVSQINGLNFEMYLEASEVK